MSQTAPAYFYIAHIHISHPLKLSTVTEKLKVFRVHHPDCQIIHTNPINNFFTIAVSQDSVISEQTIISFEKNVTCLEGVGVIFTHTTNSATKTQPKLQAYPPTYVYSACYSLNFGNWAYLLGKVGKLEKQLIKILNAIKGGVYYLRVRPKYMALILESTQPFKEDDLRDLFDFIENGPPVRLTSISTFPTT